jgi:hypothetical protein
MKTRILYRAISDAEWKDYEQSQKFNTAKNTLEGKQFFKVKKDVQQYVNWSVGIFSPPYTKIIEIDIDEDCLKKIEAEEQTLDTMPAITVPEMSLVAFNNCDKFVIKYEIGDYI